MEQFDYFKIKKYVKDKINSLSDYSLSEESFLLCEIFKKNQSQLITTQFTNKDIKKIDKIIKKRIKGKPLNKIFKHSFFFKDDFYINNSVLAPRKETEILVEKAIEIIDKNNNTNINVLDLCCGSGIIGLSCAKHANKNINVTLIDISTRALHVTKINKKRLKLNNVKIVKSDLFKGLKQENKFDIILTNPPYIKTSDLSTLDFGVKKYDPNIALDGGVDGLNFYKQIAQNATKYLTKNGIILMEIGFDQGKDVCKIFNTNFTTKIIKDYSNNYRIIVAKLK